MGAMKTESSIVADSVFIVLAKIDLLRKPCAAESGS